MSSAGSILTSLWSGENLAVLENWLDSLERDQGWPFHDRDTVMVQTMCQYIENSERPAAGKIRNMAAVVQWLVDAGRFEEFQDRLREAVVALGLQAYVELVTATAEGGSAPESPGA